MTTEANTVWDLLRARIAGSGPISFEEFMQTALYSEPFGYYRNNAPGPRSDYRTSPVLTDAYGRSVGRQLEQMWSAMGRPASFHVAEAGAGEAGLARSVIQAAAGGFHRALRWCFVEPFPSIAVRQRQAMAGCSTGGHLEWVRSVDDLGPFEGAVVANEYLDNMPCRLFEVRSGDVAEIGVGLEDGRLAEAALPVKEPGLLARTMEIAAHLEPGDRFEISVEAEKWCRSAFGTLQRGYVLLVDYGDTEPEIWTTRPAGTVVTYCGGQIGFNPLDRPGEADITSHVNFSQVGRVAQASAFTVYQLRTQRQWLTSLGLPEISAGLRAAQREAEAEGDYARALAMVAERSRVAALLQQGGLGDLKVFVAGKQAPPPGAEPPP